MVIFVESCVSQDSQNVSQRRICIVAVLSIIRTARSKRRWHSFATRSHPPLAIYFSNHATTFFSCCCNCPRRCIFTFRGPPSRRSRRFARWLGQHVGRNPQ